LQAEHPAQLQKQPAHTWLRVFVHHRQVKSGLISFPLLEPPPSWVLLALDLEAVAAAAGGSAFKCLRSVQLCGTVTVRGVLTSDIKFSAKVSVVGPLLETLLQLLFSALACCCAVSSSHPAIVPMCLVRQARLHPAQNQPCCADSLAECTM
jgi:hypothetical protein